MHTSSSDFYNLLQVPRDASPNDIKIAYHRTLLRLHPDKQHRLRPQLDVDMALLKEAYRTLSDVALRATYDASLRRDAHARSHGPRPAQVVSLEEFTATGTGEAWQYGCRCGGIYHITEDDLENGTHLVGCESCSEVIWVGYEEVNE